MSKNTMVTSFFVVLALLGSVSASYAQSGPPGGGGPPSGGGSGSGSGSGGGSGSVTGNWYFVGYHNDDFDTIEPSGSAPIFLSNFAAGLEGQTVGFTGTWSGEVPYQQGLGTITRGASGSISVFSENHPEWLWISNTGEGFPDVYPELYQISAMSQSAWMNISGQPGYAYSSAKVSLNGWNICNAISMSSGYPTPNQSASSLYLPVYGNGNMAFGDSIRTEAKGSVPGTMGSLIEEFPGYYIAVYMGLGQATFAAGGLVFP